MIFRTASAVPGSPSTGTAAAFEPQDLVRPVRGTTHRPPTTERVLGIVLWIALAMVVIGVGGAG